MAQAEMKEKTELTREEDRQKEYYNSIAGLYDQHYGNPSALSYRHWAYDMAFKNVPLKGKKALDAMCGGGEGTGYLVSRGANVVGLDISEECCALHASHYPESEVVCASMLETGLPDSHFDLVLTDSLHHLHPYVDKGMDEIYRLLKPGGYFCCWEPVSGTLADCLRRLWYRLDPKFFQTNERSISISQLEHAQSNRFETVFTFYGGNVAYLLVNCSMVFRIPPRFVRFYSPACIRLEKMLTHLQPRFLSLWVLCLMRKRLDEQGEIGGSQPLASADTGEPRR